MNLELMSISEQDARDFLKERGLTFPKEKFDFCICVYDVSAVGGLLKKGIICMYADGEKCSLGHLYTDGTALVGSILYGAAWRAAKALGYKTITI